MKDIAYSPYHTLVPEGAIISPGRNTPVRQSLPGHVVGQEFYRPPPYQDLQDLRDLCDPQDRPAGQVFQAPEEFTTKSVARRGTRG